MNKRFEILQQEIIEKCENKECSLETLCRNCNNKINRMRQYELANIPIFYWNLPMKDFKGDKVFHERINAIIKDIDAFYKKGKSLAFIGNLGVGKTYAACAILKKAIASGYSAHYDTMANIVESLISEGSRDAKTIYLETDILCLDEFDIRWVYPSEKVEKLFSQKIENILRHRYQNLLPTIVCSNTPKIQDVLGDNSSKIFDSLFTKYVETIIVTGKDFRKIPQENG